MRKLLTLFTSITITGVASTSVVACTSEYDNFMSHINSNESFVYFIGAHDCPNCQDTLMKGWPAFIKNSGQYQFDKFLNGEKGSQYKLDNIFQNQNYNTDDIKLKKEAFKNMHFYKYEVNKVDGAFDDSDVKKVNNYVLEKTREYLKISGKEYKGLTLKDINITGVPLFYFFDRGKYVGSESGAITQPQQLMDWMILHIANGHWNINI